MTGFATASADVAGATLVWELKSVNGRGLDLRIRLPAGSDHLEPEVRRIARERISRGSCQIVLQGSEVTAGGRVTLDEDALALVLAAAVRLASIEGIVPARADGILGLPGVLREQARAPFAERPEGRDAAILLSLAEAVAGLQKARAEEGDRLGAILEQQLAGIGRLIDAAAAVADGQVDLLKARIRDQIALLVADGAGLDPDRLHQEAVLAASRADVREELDRLRGHVAAGRDLLKAGKEVGRRLEFLAQEFNREANTLCSKAVDRRLTGLGMEMKAVIDQFREQVQNIE